MNPGRQEISASGSRLSIGPAHIIHYIVVAAIGVFYIVSLHEGHYWNGDFSHYIHHAVNLVEGKHYVDTGYIVSSSSKFVGPYAYGPVFPVFLTPVYWLYGLDLEAMKLVGIISLCLALLLLPKLFHQQLTRVQHIAIILLIGMNPFFWEYRNNIMPDYTFILFAYLSLILMQQLFQAADERQIDSKRQLILCSCLLGFVMYLAYGSREIGIILPFCVITYEIISRRKISLISLVSIAVFIVLAYLQYKLLQTNLTPIEIQHNLAEFSEKYAIAGGISHMDFISLDPGAILQRIQRYRWSAQSLLPFNNNAVFESINAGLFNLATVLVLLGYFIALKRKITVLEIFCAGYVAVLLLFGSPTYTRYLLPIVAPGFYYAFIAYQTLFNADRQKLKNAITVCLAVAITLSYSYGISTHSYYRLNNGLTHPKAVEMFEFIRKNTSPENVIVTRNPRMTSLFAERSSIGYLGMQHPKHEHINQFFDALDASHYVEIKQHRWIHPLMKSAPPTPRFTEVFRNTHFAIFEYQPVSSNDAPSS